MLKLAKTLLKRAEYTPIWIFFLSFTGDSLQSSLPSLKDLEEEETQTTQPKFTGTSVPLRKRKTQSVKTIQGILEQKRKEDSCCILISDSDDSEKDIKVEVKNEKEKIKKEEEEQFGKRKWLLRHQVITIEDSESEAEEAVKENPEESTQQLTGTGEENSR